MRTDALLATVDEFGRQFGNPSPDATQRASRRHFLTAASQFITAQTRRTLVPWYETRRYDARGAHLDAYRLRLDDDLLAITTLTNGDGVAVASTDYVLRPDNRYPKREVHLLAANDGGVLWTYSTDWEQAISVAGWWGFVPHYAAAWVSTLDALAAAITTTSATTFTVADADGKDALYRTRFEDGLYIKVDDEVMHVVGVNTTTNTLTVLRGQRGTTAATHLISAPITRFQVAPDIEQATVTLANWIEKRKDAQGERVMAPGGSFISLTDAPEYVLNVIRMYRPGRVVGL